MWNFLYQMRERKLVHWGAAYLAGGWLLLQVLGLLQDAFAWPDLVLRIAVVLLVVGFLAALVVSWYHGERGAQRVSGVELAMLAGILTIAGAAVAFVGGGRAPEPTAAPASAEAVLDPGSIAVLPFANLSGDPSVHALSAGIHDDLLTHLFRMGDLKVISRTSVMEYQGAARNVKEIAAALGVANIVEGGVQRAGDRLRINVQLIDARTDAHLWAQQYDRELTAENVFAIQSEIVREVAQALHARLSQATETSLQRTPTMSLPALELFRRAQELRPGQEDGYDRGNMARRVLLLEQAVALDSTFAEAWAYLGEARGMMYWFHFDRTETNRAASLRAIERALALQPELPAAFFALGTYRYWCELDYERAIEALEHAQKLLPGSAEIEYRIGAVRRRQGKLDEAAARLSHALELDPMSREIAFNLAETHQLLRAYPQALGDLERLLARAPAYVDARIVRADVYLRGLGDIGAARRELQALPGGAGGEYQVAHYQALTASYARNWSAALRALAGSAEDAFQCQFYYLPLSLVAADMYARQGNAARAKLGYDSAVAHLARRMQEDPTDARFVGAHALALSGLGRHAEALQEAQRASQLIPVSSEAWRGSWRLEDLARVYAAAGDAERAVQVLKQLIAIPSEVGPGMLRLDPGFDPIRGDPTFGRLLRSLPESGRAGRT